MFYTIKSKLVLVGALFIAMFLILGMQMYRTNSNTSELTNAQLNVEKISNSILTLRKHEKDFMARKDMKYLTKFQQVVTELDEIAKKLHRVIDDFSIDAKSINDLNKEVQSYNAQFQSYVSYQQKIGLNKKDALYGKLRSGIHNVESVLGSKNDKLLKDMLMLRRHEKDFFLRSDLKYLTEFNDATDTFMSDIDNSEFAEKTMLKEKLIEYKKGFSDIVGLMEKRGLNETLGVWGSMRDTVHSTSDALKALNKIMLIEIADKKASLMAQNIIIALVLFVLIIGVLFYITKGIQQSLESLLEIISKMCANKDLCLRAPSTSKDEIGQVSQKFNFLFAILNETIIDAKAASKNSVKISEEFGIAISKIQKRSEEESNLVGIASKKGSEVGEILKDYEIKTAENYKMTKEAHGELESVREDVVTLVQNVQSGAQVENVLAEKLNELSHEADQVKDVLVIISDIADQTNLLALNAAIEAARAGEHGRGFAVVADEVRKLAERTQKSLSEINATVNVIVQSIMDASDAMNKNAKEIEKVSQSSALVEDKISKTSETMNTTMINVDSFTESFVTIKENISTLLTDVAGVDKLSKENVESVQEMAQTANHLRSQSSDLNEKLEVFKN